MDETILKVRILAKAEMTLLKANAHRAAVRGRLFAIAIGLILITVLMVNLAAYQYLAETQSEAMSAMIVGLVNALLAVMLMISAMRVKPGPEEAMVREIREMAMSELSADIDNMKGEFAQVSDDLNKIKTGVSSALGVFRGGGSNLGAVGPALGLITAMLKK